VAGHGLSWLGLLAFLSFGIGQSAPVFAVGVVTALAKTPLVRALRPRLCSIEQQIRLAAGNGLMVLGIYFVIVG
jgi:cytochrome c biogenesis protein CcdA